VPDSLKRRSNYSPSLATTTSSESLLRLEALPSLKFPKWDEIVDKKTFEVLIPHELGEAPKPQGLFSALLKDHVEILATDAIEEPEKYNPEAVELLNEMLGGKKSPQSLTDSERRLLDQATLDFATYTPRKQAVPAPSRALPARAAKETESTEDAEPIPGVDVPVTEAPAFWWLR
jgi:hypothetical protein